MNIVTDTLNKLGLSVVARACGVSRQAVANWRDKGSLPNTEHLNKGNKYYTNYSLIIAKLAGCKRKDLLQ